MNLVFHTLRSTHLALLLLLLLVAAAVVPAVNAQSGDGSNYDNYGYNDDDYLLQQQQQQQEPDTLYHDYAVRQQVKEGGGVG